MNQIICTSNSNIPNKNLAQLSKERNNLKLQFILLLIVFTFLIIYYITFRYNMARDEKVSKELIQDFGITSIYERDD